MYILSLKNTIQFSSISNSVKVEGAILTKSGLLKSLELILGHENGKEMRDKAQALKHTVQAAASPNGTAAKDFIHLVELISVP